MQFEGKVVFVTGAARGQGRSHAVAFAEQGADVIAVDICEQIQSVAYPMAGTQDLAETVSLVEKTGRRIVAEQADVRDLSRLQRVVADGVAKLGRLDFVLANAGIGPIFGQQAHQLAAYRDAVDVMLNGAFFTIEAALPSMLAHGDGGAIVITSSSTAFKSASPSYRSGSYGSAGYTAAKHGVVGVMRYYAHVLAEKKIRVNSVHPTGVSTPMAVNEQAERHAGEYPDFGEMMQNLLPVPLVDAIDITAAVMYLCGDSGRYVTGTTLRVDAGVTLK
jgi:SDR family mycofactocin-dependent oxidoreductase